MPAAAQSCSRLSHATHTTVSLTFGSGAGSLSRSKSCVGQGQRAVARRLLAGPCRLRHSTSRALERESKEHCVAPSSPPRSCSR